MNNFAALLIGSALTVLIANPAFAAATQIADAAAKAPVKIGYVDLSRIASDSKTGKAAAASLKAKSGNLKAKLEAQQNQIEKQQKAIEAKLSTMSAAERATKSKEFQKKIEDFQKLVRSSEEEMMRMQNKLTSEITNEIKKSSASYAKSHGYTAVVDEKAILYITDSVGAVDLTSNISEMLDAQQAKHKKK